MRFIKDILLFEVETTGDDPDKDNIIQLSAILLDKDNLLEKATYNAYVRTSLLEGIITKHARLLSIPFTVLQKSPKTLENVKAFTEKFTGEIQLGVQGVKKFLFLRNMFRKVSLPFVYDYHVLDLWTIQYLFTQKIGLKKMPSVHTLMSHFKMHERNPHNALERVRLEAEILRRILKEY